MESRSAQAPRPHLDVTTDVSTDVSTDIPWKVTADRSIRFTPRRSEQAAWGDRWEWLRSFRPNGARPIRHGWPDTRPDVPLDTCPVLP